MSGVSGQEPDDFTDYMAALAAEQAESEALRSSIEAHELWRATTLTGRAVTFLTSLADTRFFEAVTAAVRDQEPGSSGQSILLLIVIFGVLSVFLVAAKIVQRVLGGEIIVEEEVIIEEKKHISEKTKRRGGREKSSKED